MNLLTVGSVAFDAIETPFGKTDKIIGGAGTFIALSASNFTESQGIVSVVGEDFPSSMLETIKSHGVNLDGLQIKQGEKTFFWSGRYHNDMNSRDTLITELNVLEHFDPIIPNDYQDTEYLMLGNLSPQVQSQVIERLAKRPKLIAMDTMNFWMEIAMDDLKKTISMVDVLFVNDEEARQLSGEYSLVKAARVIRAMGPRTLIIKKGEHGALLFQNEKVFFAPALPLEEVFDPTGAGDTFAGGFMGYIAASDDTSFENMKRAIIAGSALASFCVEKFGTERLLTISKQDCRICVSDRFCNGPNRITFMEKAAYIDALKALTTQENPLAVSREVSDLRAQFEDLLLKETHAFQVKQAEARESGEEPEEFVPDGIREDFYEVYSEYRDRRNAAQKTQKDQEDQNLRRKTHLMERLRDVIQKEENIGSALAKYKEIHEEWKAVGDIPREKRQEIQSEYSRMLEDFFYHLRIYRELREHDLHRNQQLKLDVIDRIQKLGEVENIKDVETSIRNLQHEWDEIGPVNNAEWENLKATYWENVRAVYARIQEFYDGRRNELVTNLEQKKEIVSKAKELFDLGGFNTASEWEKNTDALLKLQEEWKTSPAGPRKENEDLWKEFRGYCDQFFSSKKEHYEKLRGDYDAVAEKKRELISEVESMKDSTDWKDTSDRIIKIQQRWKQLGNAGQRNEQKLWKEFRAACDVFFNKKQSHFAEQDKALESNLTAKQALIEKINAYTLPEDKREAIDALKGFSTEFAAIGFVPSKQKDAIYNAYREALDKHYQKLKLEGAEQDRVMFQARLDTLKASPNADRALSRERGEIMDRMNKLKAEVLQYENNLGFFGRSKGADAMRKEIEKKIENSKTRITELQSKLKQLRNE